MLRVLTLAPLVIGVGSVLFGQEPSPVEPDPARIADLIKQLDADDANAREAATEELRKVGEAALPALEKILADPPSVEVKFRAQEAIDGIKLDLVRKQALRIEDIVAQAKAAQKEGWDRKTLDVRLERLIETLAAETGNKDLALPGAGRSGGGPLVQGALIKDRRVKLGQCRGSIILADTIAEVDHAYGSVIIARGAVCVAHSTNSIIIAGHVVDVSHSTKSVLLSNWNTIVSHAHDSILAGRERVEVSHADGTAFLNSPAPPDRPFPGRAANTFVKIKGITFGETISRQHLGGSMTITQTVPTRDNPNTGLALFNLANGTGEYVARVEQEIKTPEGIPIETLKGWRLIYAGNDHAIFSNGDDIERLEK